jgi:hypothetical protein
MAATFHWAEDNGPQTGGPPVHGTTRSGFGADVNYPTDMDWKDADDCTANGGTAFADAPIVGGDNSYRKYLYAHFSGAFNTILNVLWSLHTAGTSPMGTGLTLVGKVSSVYATPIKTALAGATDFSATVAIGAGLAVSLSTTGPEDAAPTATLVAPGYSQYLISQLQTDISATPGDTPAITATLQYDEN